MSYEIEAKLIETRFNEQWGSTTPIKWDNVDYQPSAETTYVDFQIHNNSSNVVGISGNNNMHRVRGLIAINIYVALNAGTRSGRELADQAAAIFREVEISNSDSSEAESMTISCDAANITRLGKIEDWFVYNVTVPFYRNEIF
jgi:hypothetical protein